jgi:hypothetical protein
MQTIIALPSIYSAISGLGFWRETTKVNERLARLIAT